MKPAPGLLVVDDVALLRRSVAELAVQLGYRIVGEAGDGNAAVEAAVRLEPDVVVMDWHMPGLDGIEATRAIRDRCPQIDVIAFSSGDEELLAPLFEAAGASAYVVKSDPGALVEELRRRIPASS